MQSHYQILGIPRDANREAIRNAYRRLARERHPDVSAGSPKLMIELNRAYEILKDPAARKAYDQTLKPIKNLRPLVPETDPLVFLMRVFQPLDSGVRRGLVKLEEALSELAYDIYDEAYAAAFEKTFRVVESELEEAGRRLRSCDWPSCWNAPLNLYQQGLRHIDQAMEDFGDFLESWDCDQLVEGREFLLVGLEILTTARAALGS